MEGCNEAVDILVSIRQEINAFRVLESDLSLSLCSGSFNDASKTRAEKVLCKVRDLLKWSTILNEKVSEHCESNGLPTDDFGLDEHKACNQQLSVTVEPVTNTVPAVSLKKPLRQIPSIRHFSDKDLQIVPGYMKGRLTTKIINDFIDKFNTVIEIKYKILKKPKKLLSSKEKQYAITFKDQETPLVKGNYFCIAEDLKEFCNYSFVNTSRSIINILRHSRRLKEFREPRLPLKYAIVEEDL